MRAETGYGRLVAASLLDLAELEPILETAATVSVAVDARRGPHVTPQVFAVFGGRIWMATPHTSVKARVLRKRPEVGLLLRGESGIAVVAGVAEVLDPAKPWSLLGAMTETAMSGPASAAYALRNLDEVRSLVTDALTLKLGPSALQRRVVVAVRPTAASVIANDNVVASQGWPSPELFESTEAEPEDSEIPSAPPAPIGGLPDAVAQLARTAGDAALGWRGPIGPLALPVHWDPDTSTATLGTELTWMLAGRTEGQASVTIDESDRRISDTVGVLLRGTAQVTSDGSAATIALKPTRTAWWTGIESGSA